VKPLVFGLLMKCSGLKENFTQKTIIFLKSRHFVDSFKTFFVYLFTALSGDNCTGIIKGWECVWRLTGRQDTL